jgi:GNAT superfamily N-acetyltransferase
MPHSALEWTRLLGSILAMAPDPKDWERHLILPDGAAVFVRPIRPDDEALYGAFFAAETAEDLRLRFFGLVKDRSPAFFSRFTHIDYAKAMAFIALDEATGDMLGVARLHRMRADAGEYAIIVRSDIKSHGLGWELMQMIVAYARAKNFHFVEGQVLHENSAMLEMCNKLGFEISTNRDDPDICDVKLAL